MPPETTRALQLAAAKKKLKEFQKKNEIEEAKTNGNHSNVDTSPKNSQQPESFHTTSTSYQANTSTYSSPFLNTSTSTTTTTNVSNSAHYNFLTSKTSNPTSPSFTILNSSSNPTFGNTLLLDQPQTQTSPSTNGNSSKISPPQTLNMNSNFTPLIQNNFKTNSSNTSPISPNNSNYEHELNLKNREIQTLKEALNLKIQEKAALDQKLTLQTNTIEILVHEKADLTSKLDSQLRLNQENKTQINEKEKNLQIQKSLLDSFELGSVELNTLLETEKRKLDALEKENLELKSIFETGEKNFEGLRSQNVELLQKLNLQAKRISELEQANIVLESQSKTKDLFIEQISKGTIKTGDDMVSIQHLLSHKLELEKTLEDKEKELNSFEIEVVNTKKDIVEKEIQNEELLKKLQETEQKIETLNSSISTFEDDTKNQKETIEKLTTQLQASTEKEKSLQEEIEKINLQQQKMESENKLNESLQYHETIQEQKKRISELEEEIRIFRESISSESTDKSLLADRLREKSDRVERLSVENKGLMSQLSELKDRFVEIMNEKALLTDEKLSSEKKIINLQKDIEKLNEISMKSTQDLNRIKQGQSEVESEINQENSLLKVELLKVQQDKGEYQTNLKKFEEEKNQLLEIIELQNKKIHDLQKSNAIEVTPDLAMKRLQESNQALQASVLEQEKMIVKLQMEVETIPEYIEMYHKERNSLKSKSTEKDKTIDHLIQLQEKQNQQLEESKQALKRLLRENEKLKRGNQGSTERMELYDSIELLENGDQNSDSELQSLISASKQRNLSFPACEHCEGKLLIV